MALDIARTLIIRRPLNSKGFILPWLPASLYPRG